MTGEKINREDVEKYYALLNHKSETELRLYNNKANMAARKFFAHSKDEFLSLVEDNAELGLNISAGLNERHYQKSGDDDVQYLGCVLIDFDAHEEGASLEQIGKTAHDLIMKFSEMEIQASLAFSGRGYHVLIPFKAIELTNDNREEWKQKLKSLKQYLVEKFAVDSSTFNLSRMSRVIGTLNIEAQTISRWVDYRGYNDNFDFIDFINTLYDKREIINKINSAMNDNKINDSVEAQRVCPFFDNISVTTKFPEGERYNVLIKNLAMYTNFTGKKDIREAYIKAQNSSASEFAGWDKAFKDQSFRKFNCGEIYNYCKRNGIKDVCTSCPYNNFRFNEKKISFDKEKALKAKFVVKKLAYQGGKTIIGKYGVLTKKLLYNIFETGFLTGNRSIYCVTTNQSDLREGDQIKFIVPLKNVEHLYQLLKENPPENKVLEKMAEAFPLAKKDAQKMLTEGTLFDWMIEEDLKTLDPYFVALGSGVDENDIKSLSNEDAKSIVEDHVTLGLGVDSRVKLSMEIDFFIPDLATADFKTYQFYNPHKILFTGTKAGKTSMSQRMGHNTPRATVSNLLGFATSDEINRGSLHESVIPLYIDELEEEDSKLTFGKLLNYFESGSVNIDVGKKSIQCDGLASVTFLGNPKESSEYGENTSEIEIVNQFNQTLNAVTNNFSAFGSRMGLVIFDSATKQISGTAKFSDDEQDILLAKFEYLRQIAAPKFTKLFKEPKVKTFLNTPFDEQYAETIKLFAQKSVVKSIREFMNGTLNSYRHTNGAAFRLACLDYLIDIISDDPDYDKIVARAKEYLEICKSINLASFKKFVDNKTVDEFFMKGYKNAYEQESFDIKTILSSIYSYIRATGKKSTIYISELYSYMVEDKNRPENRSVPSIIERFDRHLLEQKYRIEYNNIDNIEYFSIRDMSPLIFIFGDFAEKNIYSKQEKIDIITTEERK